MSNPVSCFWPVHGMNGVDDRSCFSPFVLVVEDVDDGGGEPCLGLSHLFSWRYDGLLHVSEGCPRSPVCARAPYRRPGGPKPGTLWLHAAQSVHVTLLLGFFFVFVFGEPRTEGPLHLCLHVEDRVWRLSRSPSKSRSGFNLSQWRFQTSCRMVSNSRPTCSESDTTRESSARVACHACYVFQDIVGAYIWHTGDFTRAFIAARD
ncbi:hypothetical protein OF83DRAFT_466591 [Amylostereum chailletii]|nr:hypothetical protein OF83DRAFT_466591 [Amylostereum chailletii]